ncbi:MAG: ATP phosphoribosyltransferase regulatory subunit [Acidobacteria bacterium]|nr:ATP phosphoribosyltransferase regulatory subunit [Acidobacteriota bacterium]
MVEPLSKIPGGMRYYFGAEARLRRGVEDAVMAVFDGWSYEEITTPCVDYLALFERGMGYEQAHRAFRFTDTDGGMLALRPDVTSSVARAAATLFADRARPLRLCYASQVFRQQQLSHALWRRESKHLGCELFGVEGLNAEIEVLCIAAEILTGLNLGHDFRVTISSVEVFNGICEYLALDDPQRERMRQLLDRRDAAELQKFLGGFATTETERASFARLTQLSGKGEILEEARRIITNPRSAAALDDLEALWRIIRALDLSDFCDIDLGDVSGLDYYTGLTCKIYVRGAGTHVGGGGRYDSLTANFGRPEPAVGFVLDLDSLTDVLMRRETAAPRAVPAGAAAPPRDGDPAALFADARRRRARRERVSVDGLR